MKEFDGMFFSLEGGGGVLFGDERKKFSNKYLDNDMNVNSNAALPRVGRSWYFWASEIIVPQGSRLVFIKQTRGLMKFWV